MRGKLGLIVGLGVGYVLGTRAGRARYEQIKKQAEKVWELEPVQKQVGRAKEFAQANAMAVPRVAWNGITKVVKAASETKGTPGEKVDAAAEEAAAAAEEAAAAAEDVKKAAD